MALDGPVQGVVRSKPPGHSPMRTVVCRRCGGTNPPTTKRCRACLSPLGEKPKAAPRVVRPTVEPRSTEIDAALGGLETLILEDEPVETRFQCPRCNRLVSESATRCACGAVFEAESDVLGYECPACGARVSESATRCACGARFAG